MQLWSAVSVVLLSAAAAGQLPQVTWQTGLGNINHVVGPSDQPLQIATPSNNQNIILAPNGTGVVQAKIAAFGILYNATNGLCVAGGASNPYFLHLVDCLNYFNNTGQNAGTIWWNPEEVTVNPFANVTSPNGGNNSYTIYLATGYNATSCPDVTPPTAPNCFLLDVPLVLGTGVDLIGQGMITDAGNYAAGSAFSFSTKYPSALGQPLLPTISCNSTGGHIGAVGPVDIGVVQSNNLNAGNGSATSAPGFTILSVESNPVTKCTFTSGSTNSISISGVTALTSSNTAFNAQDIYICAATASGQEICGGTGSGGTMTCSSSGMTNGLGCSIGSSTLSCGSATNQVACLTDIPLGGDSGVAGNGYIRPPVSDMSNPVISVGTGDASSGNAFGNRMSRFSVVANGRTTTPPCAGSGGCLPLRLHRTSRKKVEMRLHRKTRRSLR